MCIRDRVWRPQHRWTFHRELQLFRPVSGRRFAVVPSRTARCRTVHSDRPFASARGPDCPGTLPQPGLCLRPASRLDYLNLATDPGRRTRFATAGRGVLVAAVLRPLPLTAPPETSPGRQRSVFLTKNSRFSSIPPKPGHTSRLRMTIPKRLRCILRSQI